ncbi:MAG: DMT family transporter [Ignavibacteriales bacterium]|nr:DMT family transporter [Ignavibacteriales bacterium]
MNSKRALELKVELWLLVVVVVWAANYPVAKYGLQGMNPFVFNALRYLVAALVLAAPLVRWSLWQPIERTDVPRILRAGMIASVIYQIAFITGLSLTTAGNSAVLLSTSPLWTMFLNARIHKEKIQPLMWVGMGVSLCGVIMIISGSGKKIELGGNELIGDVITLAAAALWGLNTNLQKPLLVRYSPTQLAFLLTAIGAIGLSLIAAPALVSYEWTSVHWTYYLAAILSGALSIGIANGLWSNGVRQLGPSRTANFNNLVPVFAFGISYLALREQLLPIQFLGAGVTIVGVWIARR